MMARGSKLARWMNPAIKVLRIAMIGLSCWLFALPAGAAPAPASDTPAVLDANMPELSADLSRLDGGWYTMTYHPSLEAQVRHLADQAEEVRAELRRILTDQVLKQVDIYVGRTSGEMETYAPLGTRFPRYASGVAFSEMHVVLLSATPRYPGVRHDLAEVFRHELAHIALHDAVGRGNVPRWFNEGFAIHASDEASTARLQSLWTATVSQSLIPFSELSSSFPADSTTASVAYAQAADMIRYLLRSHEQHRFDALIGRLTRGQSFEQAVADAYSTDWYTLEKQWRKDVAQRYTFWPVIFGGSLIWVAGFGLMVAAYVRRRRKAARTMERWAREEAMQDARSDLMKSALGQAALRRLPVRIVVSTESQSTSAQVESSGESAGDRMVSSLPQELSQGGRPVPTVEHEGETHTLH